MPLRIAAILEWHFYVVKVDQITAYPVAYCHLLTLTLTTNHLRQQLS